MNSLPRLRLGLKDEPLGAKIFRGWAEQTVLRANTGLGFRKISGGTAASRKVKVFRVCSPAQISAKLLCFHQNQFTCGNSPIRGCAVLPGALRAP